MRVYWCDIQPLLSCPEPFVIWCRKHTHPLEDYLCTDDAVRHFAGIQLRRLAEKNEAMPFINVSHSGSLVLCACSRQRVGIDCEEIGCAPAIPSEFFTAQERDWMSQQEDPNRAFFRLWTVKESIIKAHNGVLADILALPSLVRNGTIVSRIGTLTIREIKLDQILCCISVVGEDTAPIELIHLPWNQLFPV